MITKSKAFRRSIASSVILILFTIFSDQLFTTLWILIVPIGFIVTLYFLIAAVKNILFWANKRGEISFAWLPLLIQLLPVFVVCVKPSHNRSRANHRFTVDLGSYKPNGCPLKLYREAYCVFGMGALGSDVYSDYLTDSLNFRLYLGTYDEGYERINVTCKGDSVTVKKTSSESVDTYWSDPKTLESRTHSISALKKGRIFE